MNWQSLLFGGAAIGILTMMWENIKWFFKTFSCLFVDRVVFFDHQQSDELIGWMLNNGFRPSKLKTTSYTSWLMTNKKTGRGVFAPCEILASTNDILFYGFIPVFLPTTRTEEEIKAGKPEKSFWTIRNPFFSLSKIARKSILQHKDSDFYITTIDRYPMDVHGCNKSSLEIVCEESDDTSKIILSEKMSDVKRETEFWLKNKSWYSERGIPWKRGYLLYGEPGSGKTSFVVEVAKELNIPLFVFRLAEISDKVFRQCFSAIQKPCIVSIEDFDTIFDGRENITPRAIQAKSGLVRLQGVVGEKQNQLDDGGFVNFDTLLSVIDGTDSVEGFLLFITTNNPDTLDPAIATVSKDWESVSSRPGRIDRCIYLGNMPKDAMRKMAKIILKDNETGIKIMEERIENGPEVTPAVFREECIRMALEHLWANK